MRLILILEVIGERVQIDHDSIYVLKERFTGYSQRAYQRFSRRWDERRMSLSMRAETMVYGILQSLAILAM